MSHLTPQQSLLQDDLRGLIKGDVRCDDLMLLLYSTDASLLQCHPQVVVWPKDTNDVLAVIGYAQSSGLPVHARGAGTGTSGGALGGGIILDFTRYMRRVLAIDEESVTVQPGVIAAKLDSILKYHRRRFAPHSGSAATTIGSLLARNGAGTYWLRDRFPLDYVERLTVVLSNGEKIQLDVNDLPQAMPQMSTMMVRSSSAKKTATEHDSVTRGVALARGIVLGPEHVFADKIYGVLAPYGGFTETNKNVVNRAGYHLDQVLVGEEKRSVDLLRLIVGSEGTLGLIVEAKLKTSSLPFRGMAAAFFFDSIDKAMRAVPIILTYHPILCELFDRRRLNMLKEWDRRFATYLPPEAEVVLLVELEAGTIEKPVSPKELREALDLLCDELQQKNDLSFAFHRVNTESDFVLFDAFLHRAALALFRLRGNFQPIPFFDDLAVPVSQLSAFQRQLMMALKKYEITASLSGHVGHGHFRINPIVDLSLPKTANTLKLLAEDLHALVWDHQGTISSEEATGYLQSRHLPLQYPKTFGLFRKIKNIFDPTNLFNPGKVISDAIDWRDRLRTGLTSSPSSLSHSDSSIWTQEFFAAETVQQEQKINDDFFGEHTPAPTAFNSQLEFQLKWEPKRIGGTSQRCNGCGDCRQIFTTTRMCPMFRAQSEEEVAPRAKANVIRGLLHNELELKTIISEESKTIADYCIHCQMCRFECPAEIDLSQMAFRCKSAYHAAHGLSFADRMLSYLDRVLQFSAIISCTVNWSLSNRVMRWMLEKLIHLPQGRKMPTLSKMTYLSQRRWSQWQKRRQSEQSVVEARSKKKRVALFIDTYLNFFDVRLVELAVRVLEHNDYIVEVPLLQRSSGLNSIAVGHSDRAERIARHNTFLLAKLIRQDYDIVTLEPSSASCFTQDYRYILEDEDSELVAANATDFCDYLYKCYSKGELKTDFVPITMAVGYHAPCRGIAQTTGRANAELPAELLLRLIPNLNVKRIECGCCGMAGVFGLKRENYRRSLQIGMPLFQRMRAPEIDAAVSDCSACRMQLEQGVAKPVLHPIKLLATAYELTNDEN